MEKEEEEKLMWYAAGPCRYWTDDFSKLGRTPVYSIPCCPKCGMVGFQTTLSEWMDGAKEFDRTHPGYLDELMSAKEKCCCNSNAQRKDV